MLFNGLFCSATGVSRLEEEAVQSEHELDPADQEALDIERFYSEEEVQNRCDYFGLTPFKPFTDKVEFISLGGYCLVTMAFQALGLRRKAYPLDYVRSSARGVIDLFENDFEDFLTGTKVATPEHPVTFQDTAWGGSFWHHDISNRKVRADMQRRVKRLLGKSDVPSSTPRIFCRAVNSTAELDLSLELLEVLRSTYSGPVRLLLLIENQAVEGPIAVAGEADLLFYRVAHAYSFASCHEERMLGYMDPLVTAIKMWAGEPMHVAHVSTLADVECVCDSIDGGDPGSNLFAAELLEPAHYSCPPPTVSDAQSMLPVYSTWNYSLEMHNEHGQEAASEWQAMYNLFHRSWDKFLRSTGGL